VQAGLLQTSLVQTRSQASYMLTTAKPESRPPRACAKDPRAKI
jgi:hypothetical protein